MIRWLNSSILRFFRQSRPFSHAKHRAQGKWSQLSLMETGESRCRFRFSRSDVTASPSAVSSSAARVQGPGGSSPQVGRWASTAVSGMKFSAAMARQRAKAARRWQRAALMQPNSPATVPVSSSVQRKPA